MATVTLNELGRHVFDSAAKRIGSLVSVVVKELFAKAKIAQAHMPILIEQNVFEFNVPVDDAEFVQMFERQCDFAYVEAHLVLVEMLAFE